MTEPAPDTRPKGNQTLLLGGKILLGVGLIVAIIVLVTGFRDKEPGLGFADPNSTIHGFSQSPEYPDQSGNATPATFAGPTVFDQAKASGGSLAARATGAFLKVYSGLTTKAKPLKDYPRLDKYGMPTTLMVTGQKLADDGALWYEVLIPGRPNGKKGWVPSTSVEIAPLTYSVRISLSKHLLELYNNGQKLKSFPVGLGKEGTKTPTGTFFYTSKVRPRNPDTVYGKLVIVISAFSDTLTDWAGGGQVGIHGTNNPSDVGKDVSHGCIRMRNQDVLALSEVTPLGTPVIIQQ